jgi:hypothetical protein
MRDKSKKQPCSPADESRSWRLAKTEARACLANRDLPPENQPHGFIGILLSFIGLLTVTGRLERCGWADALEQLAYFWRERLPDEMPVHLAQLVVDHPS